MPVVSFKPSGKTIEVAPRTLLLDACRGAGFAVAASCGNKGLCGKCRVKVLAGEVPADKAQAACLPAAYLDKGWRASCIVRVTEDLVLADPDVSDIDGAILTDFLCREPRDGAALWQRDLELAKPSATDQRDDSRRLLEALHAAGVGDGRDRPRASLSLLAALPETLRANDFSIRAAGVGDRLLSVGPAGDAAGPCVGLAVDIGTTTIAVALCDLFAKSVLAVESVANPQARHGDDVISRIDYAARGSGELREMRSLVLESIQALSDAARRAAKVMNEPLIVAIGGNTVMNHLFLGVQPGALALSPFIPAFNSVGFVSGNKIGWNAPVAPDVYVLPSISAYVGGDITAGILAHDAHRGKGVTLFLDVGTNGEIVLAVDNKTYACATAAGPAFEGARIRQGMRAAAGAISKVGLLPDGLLEIGTIDSVWPAKGICGTGLLDAVAVLRRAGVIDETGRILDADEALEEAPGLNPEVAALIHESDSGNAVWLAQPTDSSPMGVALTQQDVREFQLAKGAVAAGVKVLLGHAGLKAGDIDRVLLAGGFGNYLDPASAIDVGLLPGGIERDRVRSVGNASLAGTRLCLLSEVEREEAEALARAVEYIELSGRGDFQAAFAEEMLFAEL